ncbi:unnamed protein product [Prunus brigantina]
MSKALLDAETCYPKLYSSSHRHDVLYGPKTAIKAQALVDFVAEFTPSAEEEKLVNKKKESSNADGTSAEPSQPRDMWQLRVDGASNQKRAGAGVVITIPDGTLLEQAIILGFLASNNEAEYETLLISLRLAKELAIKKLAIYSDSQLIMNQVSSVSYLHHPTSALGIERACRRTSKPKVSAGHPIDEDPSWQDPNIDYLMNGNLPTRYYIQGNKLIRRSYFSPHLTCIKQDSHTVAHKERPTGDTGQQPEAWQGNNQKRPSGDATRKATS